MKKSSKLVYVWLSLGLVVCLCGLTFLGYSLFFKDKTLKMENFENAPKTEVLKWVTKNGLENSIKYVYEYSDTVEEGNVISQSIKADDKVDGEFTVTISKGSVITLNISDYKTKDEFDKFISQYPNIKVSYEVGDSANSNSELLKFSKDKVDVKNDELLVFLAKNDGTADNKDKKEEKDEKDSGNTATIPGNLLGMEETKFIKTINDLGFKNLKKSETKYYSFTSKKDTVYSYDDGKIDLGKTINYAISLGDYPTAFNAKEYDGQTLDAVNKLVKKYNDLNAHITLKTTNLETTDSKLVGKLANSKCTKDGTKSIITANVYVAPSTTINVDNYAGKAEDVMLKALKDKGITKFNKGTAKYSVQPVNTIAYNDTGSKTKNDTINYYLSLGSYENNGYSTGDFVDKTLDEAKNKVNYYNNLGANITLNTSFEETEDESKNNIVYGSTISTYNSDKHTLTLSVYKMVAKYDLPSESFIKDNYSKSSYDATVSALTELFNGKFTNVQYIGVENALDVGQIVDVKVNGSTTYTQGSFRYDTPIIIEICQTAR